MTKKQKCLESFVKECSFEDVAITHQRAFFRSHMTFCLNLFGKKVSAELVEAIRQDFIPTNDNQDVGTIAEAINENEVRESLKGIKKICKNLSQKL